MCDEYTHTHTQQKRCNSQMLEIQSYNLLHFNLNLLTQFKYS
jgi:hypothetical protein